MQIESHATPSIETPQQRYATLHRAIERGLDSDEIWRELAEVSVRLGHADEATTCLRRVRNPVIHSILESRLVHLGVVEDPAARNGLARRHTAAPAASSAGAKNAHDTDKGDVPGLGEHIVDALQYLFHQHMPWLVVVTTLAFPVVVGLGGFLTAGGSPLVLAAIAAVPGLSVLAVVGAMGRQILLASSGGSADVPNVPELGQLLRDARTFLLDAALVLGILVVPTLLAMVLGAPLSTTLPGLAIGAFFTPLAWGLRQLRGDFGALSPVTLLRGLTRCGPSYAGIVPVCWLLFAPAALTGWATWGRPVWVQIAAIGPLFVVPLFVVSRLLGTWLDSRRQELGNVLVAVRRPVKPALKAPKVAGATKAAPAAADQTPAPRFPRRPEGLEHFEAPSVRPLAPALQTTAARPTPTAARPRAATAPTAAPRPRPQPTPAARSTPPAPRAQPAHAAQPATPVRQTRPAPATPPAPKAPVAPVAKRRVEPAPPPAAKAPRAIEGRGPRRAGSVSEDAPDLTQLPGAVVLTGQDRARHGAAARPKV